MSKVGIFFTDLAINIIIGIEWGIFIVLYSAVELFNKIFKNGNMSKIMKWIMSKLKKFLAVLLTISIICLVWRASVAIFLATIALFI